MVRSVKDPFFSIYGYTIIKYSCTLIRENSIDVIKTLQFIS